MYKLNTVKTNNARTLQHREDVLMQHKRLTLLNCELMSQLVVCESFLNVLQDLLQIVVSY